MFVVAIKILDVAIVTIASDVAGSINLVADVVGKGVVKRILDKTCIC